MTLAELKTMSDPELHRWWIFEHFPFDSVASCGYCITAHRYTPGCEKHKRLKSEVVATMGQRKANSMDPDDFTTIQEVRRNLDRIFALRLLNRRLYANPVPADALAEANGRL